MRYKRSPTVAGSSRIARGTPEAEKGTDGFRGESGTHDGRISGLVRESGEPAEAVTAEGGTPAIAGAKPGARMVPDGLATRVTRSYRPEWRPVNDWGATKVTQGLETWEVTTYRL